MLNLLSVGDHECPLVFGKFEGETIIRRKESAEQKALNKVKTGLASNYAS